MTQTPSRDDSATLPCPVCGELFEATGRRRYCSDRCRRAGWARRRRPPVLPVALAPPSGPRRPLTVYYCDSCDLRALGEQRCDECGSFMRRIGLGGNCPECFEAIGANELIDVIEDRQGPRR